MVASMVGGIVMANGGKVEYDIPNTRLTHARKW